MRSHEAVTLASLARETNREVGWRAESTEIDHAIRFGLERSNNRIGNHRGSLYSYDCSRTNSLGAATGKGRRKSASIKPKMATLPPTATNANVARRVSVRPE